MADGIRFSGGGVRGGLYPAAGAGLPNEGMPFGEMRYTESDGAALVTFTGTPCGDVTFTLSESGIRIQADRDAGLRFVNRFAPDADGLPQMRRLGPAALGLTYEGFAYTLALDKGFVDDSLALTTEEGELIIRLDGAAEGKPAVCPA